MLIMSFGFRLIGTERKYNYESKYLVKVLSTMNFETFYSFQHLIYIELSLESEQFFLCAQYSSSFLIFACSSRYSCLLTFPTCPINFTRIFWHNFPVFNIIRFF